MSNRIAFFSDGNNLIENFDLEFSGDAVFEPHYNIARGHHIPVITKTSEGFDLTRHRWGKGFEKDADQPGVLSAAGIDDLEREAIKRVIIPISGFYIWKPDGESSHPFFVRKIDNSLLYVAGFMFKDSENEFSYVEMLMMESNTLIQPIREIMPMILKEELSKRWLQTDMDGEELKNKIKDQFLITDLTVHRVSKDLNDLSKNDPSLIQPIPK